ncbi:MAG: PAS domain S-box protein [Deltaproteobacteria bacterium]|nr:MAG: PAS domain S-box protein [Deltaproteobacteria bacterium]
MRRPTLPPTRRRALLAGALALAAGGAAALPLAAPAGAVLLGGGVLLLAATAWHGERAAARLQQRLAEAEQASSRLDSRLEEAQRRYEQILHHASDAMFFVDPHDGTLLEVNRRAEEMLGYTCGDIRHLSLGVLFPGRHRRRFLNLVRKILKHGHGEEPELLFRRRDGTLLYGAVQARLGWLGDQRVVHGSFHDVTPSVHLAHELRRYNQQLELLNEIARRVAKGQEISSLLATVLDQVVGNLGVAGGGIFLLHHQGTEMHLAFHRGMPPELVEEFDRLRPGSGLIGAVAASGRPRMSVDMSKDRRCCVPAVGRDGWRSFLAVPLLADESCLGVLFVFERGPRVLNRHEMRLLQMVGQQVGPLMKSAQLFDELQWQNRLNQASLRELERSRAALRDNLQQLERHNRMLQGLEQMKGTFLSLASHELRTPLTFICSGAELLQNRAADLDEPGRCALEAILHGSERLRHLVDDLLEAARLEAQSVYLAREEFDAAPLLEGLVADFQAVCAQRRLTCSLDATLSAAIVRGDAHHLRRALGRLLENAVKFTPEGGWIRIGTALHSGSDVQALAGRLGRFSATFFNAPRSDRYLEICIRDSGIGLAPGEEERIFEKFYAGDDIASHSTSRERFGGKGVGIGLTLARGLIDAHDGILWAESTGPAQGSSFRLLLPLQAPEGGR